MKATGRFLRHDGICRPMNVLLNHLGRSTAPRPGSTQAYCKDAPEVPRPTHRRDEYRPVIPQRVARQHCPPPLHRHAHPKTVTGSATMNFQRTVNSVLTVCLSPGDRFSHGAGSAFGSKKLGPKITYALRRRALVSARCRRAGFFAAGLSRRFTPRTRCSSS
jgi:hypothetical protein